MMTDRRNQVSPVVSAQLVGPRGTLIAQHDSLPGQGNFPTTGWPAGRSVLDPRQITLPEELDPGDYQVRAILYDLSTGERLSVAGGEDYAVVWTGSLR